MKKLQLSLVIMALIGGMSIVSAQRVVKIYPKHGTVVRTVYKPMVIVHRGATYHYADGVWYTPKHGSYVVCSAPSGVIVKRIPRGRKIVHINGRKLYRYKGIVYQKTRGGFVVVRV